jgi:hypothetical protein
MDGSRLRSDREKYIYQSPSTLALFLHSPCMKMVKRNAGNLLVGEFLLSAVAFVSYAHLLTKRMLPCEETGPSSAISAGCHQILISGKG